MWKAFFDSALLLLLQPVYTFTNMSSDQHMLFAGCSCNSAWQQAGMSELCSRQPQARLGNVTGHPGNSGKHAFHKQDTVSMAAFSCTNQPDRQNCKHACLHSLSPLLS